MKKNRIIFSIICLSLLLSVHVALSTPSAPVVYVAGDGTGDFNSNGSNDHIPINQALQFLSNNYGYTTVHLKGPFTYVINDSLLVGSNTILEGDSTTVIKLANNASWDSLKPLIRQKNDSGNSNITVRGFEVNGNYAGNSNITLGTGYYNVMYFTYSSNIKVYNMYMHDGTGDGLRVNKGKNIQFYNNTIYKLGHDGLYALRSEDIEAWNNRITCRTNSGLRIWNTNKVKLHDNVIGSFYDWSAGGPGIQIEKGHDQYSNQTYVVNDVEVYNNTINNTYGPGIWIIGIDNTSYPKEEAQNVHIHHNTFYNTGTNPNIYWVGGIVAAGFYDTLIENNVFDGVYHAAIVHMYNTGTTSTSVSYTSMFPAVATDRGRLGFDDVSTTIASALAPTGSGYTTIVRNNIIVNTQKRTKDPNNTGYAIINNLPDTHTFMLDNNCLYNNTGGNYKNASSITDIYVDPLFADQKNHNYCLMSKTGRWSGFNWVNDSINSPCIDAGYPLSDYLNEPEPNGGRINIGPQGNTMYASKSAISVFPGYINSPKDPDHDGLYEDTNGNGKLDFDDVIAYHDNMDRIVANNLTAYFDYDGNKQIDFNDVVKQYDMI